MTCPVGGCGNSPTPFASGQSDAANIAVDAQYVYWTDYYGNSVLKVAK
jgi:hypothetical protein